jgi:multisubunit Na+/H+ antiporter MnhF subunit
MTKENLTGDLRIEQFLSRQGLTGSEITLAQYSPNPALRLVMRSAISFSQRIIENPNHPDQSVWLDYLQVMIVQVKGLLKESSQTNGIIMD